MPSAVQHYVDAARAPNTARTYAAQWRAFAVWCDQSGRPALPASPEIIAEYLAQRAQAGAAVASLNVTLAAVRFAHMVAGFSLAIDGATVALVMKGIRRQHLRPQRQATPLTGDLLRQMLAGPKETAQDLRNGALLGLLYVFGLRAAEAVSLDWREGGEGGGWLHIGEDRAEIVLFGSKASPGQTERVVVPTADNPFAFARLADWIASARITPGTPLLRPVTRGGRIGLGRLHSGNVSYIVKRAMAQHFQRSGLPREIALTCAAGFSAHSGRVGVCVSAAEAGVAPQHVAALVRHKSLAMARRYAERADQLKCSPHRVPGVGV